METDNILTNQMQVSRPVLFILFSTVSVRIITDSGNIICQCIQPHINYMLIVKVYRNAPFKGSTGNTKIL